VGVGSVILTLENINWHTARMVITDTDTITDTERDGGIAQWLEVRGSASVPAQESKFPHRHIAKTLLVFHQLWFSTEPMSFLLN